MNLTKVGIVIGILISNASAADNTDWFGKRLFDAFAQDVVGSRTGHATSYSEHSLGVTWWPDKIVTLRPELRFDHSYDTAAFDNGTRRSQLVASMDFIIHY